MIKRTVISFSIIFFVVVAVGGTMAFVSAMKGIIFTDAQRELSNLLERKVLELEGSVDKEMDMVLMLADSALVKRYFTQYEDEFLKTLALDEFAVYGRTLNDSVFWVNDSDKVFYTNGRATYTINPTDPAEYWYNMTLRQTEKYNFNINYNAELNQTNLWINAPVFVQRKAVGIVGTGINLNGFINNLYKDHISSMPFYLFNKSSEITGADDSSLVANKMKLSDQFGETSRLIEDAAQGLSGGIKMFHQGKAEYAVAYIPTLEWYIVGILPFTASMYLNTGMTVLFIAMVVVVIAIFIIFNGFILNILHPLLEVERVAQRLSDMDFEVDIRNFRSDEIGIIQRALIKIRDSLKKAMSELHGNLSNVAGKSETLNAIIEESSATMKIITGDMDAMQSEADAQMKSVAQTAMSLEGIIDSINTLNTAAQTQAAHITQSSAAIEEMVAHIDSIRHVVGDVSKTTDTLSNSSSEGHSMLVKLTQAISQIHEQSATLQGANKTIADIAGQTNILAMNAAIEAAHAGESGKGFAVVAGEIRKLAELSAKESNAISEEVKKIEQGIEQITIVCGQTVGAIDTIFTGIKTVDSSFMAVNRTMEEQAAGGSQILTALKNIQDMAGQVQSGTSIIQQQSGSIRTEMVKLKNLSQNVTAQAREVKSASKDIVSFLENAKDAAE